METGVVVSFFRIAQKYIGSYISSQRGIRAYGYNLAGISSASNADSIAGSSGDSGTFGTVRVLTEYCISIIPIPHCIKADHKIT